MNEEKRLNCSFDIYNSVTKFFEFLLNMRDDIKQEDINLTKISLLSTYMLSIKEEIIEKKENMNYQSRFYDNAFEVSFKKIYDLIPPIVLNGERQNEAAVFSIIRNKFAHGDFGYIKETNELEFISYGTYFKLDANILIDYFTDLLVAMKFLKKGAVTRNILYNKSVKRLNKKLETKEEARDFLKYFFVRDYKLESLDINYIPYEVKMKFEESIDVINNSMNKGENTKALENEIINDFYKLGYVLSINKKKLKDEKQNEEIIEALLNNTMAKKSEDDLESLTYNYGEIIKKIMIGESSDGILFGALMTLTCLDGCRKVKDNFIFKKNVETGFDEMLVGILIARFNNIYCNQLDDIFKNGNRYCFERDAYLKFEEFNFEELNPKIIKINQKEIENIDVEIKSIISKINTSIEREKENEKTKKAFEEKNLINAKKEFYDQIKNRLEQAKYEQELLYEKYLDLTNYKEIVKEDYDNNDKYFYNLAIIEGIRNSIAHGNIEILNGGKVNNFNDLIIRFTNIYEGEICFLLEVSVYEFQSLFEAFNIDILNSFFSKKKVKYYLKNNVH